MFGKGVKRKLLGWMSGELNFRFFVCLYVECEVNVIFLNYIFYLLEIVCVKDIYMGEVKVY